MQKSEIFQIINNCFQEKEVMNGIAENENFFNRGVSSLTVVELQIVIEKLIKLTAQTSDLMRTPTIKGWADIYFAIASETNDEDLGVA